jgi:hypothetical protein
MAAWISAGIAASIFLLIPASTMTELTDEDQTVAAGDWKYIDVPLHDKAARIIANFEVLSDTGKVRIALFDGDDLEHIDASLKNSLDMTPTGRRGFLAGAERRIGDYVVVLDNQEGREAARVHWRVAVDFGAEGRLTPRRQITVVAVSCVVFLGLAGFSAQRLRRAIRRSSPS